MPHFPRFIICLLCFVICSVTIPGCAAHHLVTRAERREIQRTATEGLQMEQMGIMSSADYQRRKLLENDVDAGKKLDDNDVDWLIVLLNKPSKQPGILQDMVMLVFLRMHNIAPSQQQKIREAMRPILSSEDPRTAKVVLRKLQRLSSDGTDSVMLKKLQRPPGSGVSR